MDSVCWYSRVGRDARARRGAVFVDLLVVVGIIAILASLVVPMMMSARDRSTRTRCMGRLREIGFALQSYADDHKGRLPMTRWSRGAAAWPDLSNSGFDASDPFGAQGPDPNNVPAALFLLIRTQRLEGDAVTCPAIVAEPEYFQDSRALLRSNFSDVRRNLSYGFQNPYADEEALEDGFDWHLAALPRRFALAADRGPAPNFCDTAVSPDCPADGFLAANSANHEGRGQNVLYADLSVEFTETPFAGVARDHIYRTQNGSVTSSPMSGTDSVLLPTAD